MREWRCRELEHHDDIVRAVEDIATWRYPRPLTEWEITRGIWCRMGSTVVWWYQPPPDGTVNSLGLHLAVAPRVRGVWPVRRWWVAAQLFAEMVGCDMLVVAPMDGDCHVTDYVSRLGWVEGPDGTYLFPL